MLTVFNKTIHNITICTLVSMVFFMVASRSNAQSIQKEFYPQTKLNKDSVAQSLLLDKSDTIKGLQHKDSTKKRYIIRRLYGFFIRKDALESSGKIIREFESSQKFIEYANKEIAEVRIVRLKIFGQSIFDTTITPTSLTERFGNSLHLLTSKRVIENNLLFREGDLLKPVDLSETEQLLRDLPFIEDVNIAIEMLADTNKVRAIVITKDKWTLSFSLRVDNAKKGKTVLSEDNIAGTGLGLAASGYYDKAHPDTWGYKGEFDYTNIAGSFINSNLWMREGLGYNSYFGSLNREFYSSKTMFAGGVSYFLSKEPYRLYRKDSLISIDYNVIDGWIGHSFRVSRKSSLAAPYNLTLAFKYRKVDFNRSDSTSTTYNPYFHSTHQWLASLGLTNQNLYQSNLIYGFGGTEDIPIGFKIQFSSGIEQSPYQRRVLVSGEMSAAEITPIGYLYLSFRTGGYLADESRVEQAAINIRSTYITNLFSLGRFDIRQFVKYDFTRGFSRFDGEREYIALRNTYGIRGLSSNKLIGNTRLMINLETVFFSPLYVYGFRFAYFLFCDMGLIGPSDDLVYSNPMYSGFGLGLRVKNESLIFPTFYIRFGYYPKFPQDAEVANWLISTERRKQFEHFRIREPYVLPYE
ncbi:MAG: hypothetical protein AB7S48_12940 [Bacteroidales bacterium]